MNGKLDTFEGVWEGLLHYQKAAGIYDPDWPPDAWRLVISKETVSVFIKRDNSEYKEVKSGKYRLQTYMTNAIVFSIDSGQDEDGVWVETESFLLTRVAPNKVTALLAGAVNNLDAPANSETRKFFYIGIGEMSCQEV